MIRWDNLKDKLVLDRYFVTGTLGQGGAGKVYLATDNVTGEKRALKTFDPNQSMSNAYKRFEMEARILSKLDHPNIVKFYEFSRWEGVDIIVMECVEGISLEKKIAKEKSLSQEEAIKYTKQLLSALKDVHSHKVFHRDIKPDNIQINVEGNVKLLDFGIVQESFEQELTRQGSVIGTISYLAPEIIRSANKKSNERTDVYSVGVMMYQLVTGVKPYNADDGLIGAEKNNNLGKKIVFEKAVPPKELDNSISEELNYFIMKMIEKDPIDRYQNCDEALADIEIIERGGTLEEMVSFLPSDSKEKNVVQRQIIIMTAVAVFALLVLMIVIILALI